MALTINPVVYRSRKIYRKAGAAHIAGGLVGGATLSSLIWILARELPSQARLWLAIGLLSIAIVIDLSGRKFPSRQKQVPSEWRGRMRPAKVAFVYGAALGFAVFTRIYYAAIIGFFLTAGLITSLAGAALLGAIFGATRSAVSVAKPRAAKSMDDVIRSIQVMTRAKSRMKVLLLVSASACLLGMVVQMA